MTLSASTIMDLEHFQISLIITGFPFSYQLSYITRSINDYVMPDRQFGISVYLAFIVPEIISFYR